MREFSVAGTRHYDLCILESCELSLELTKNQVLKLIKEKGNKFDKFAVEVYTLDDKKLGYFPKFYSEVVTTVIQNNYEISCNVIDMQKVNYCGECVKGKLKIIVDK